MIRWAPYVLAGFALAEIDWDRGVRDFLEKASPKGRLGVRIGLLIAMTAPLWMWGRPSTARGLRGEDRGRLLHELLEHRIFFVRELTLLLKLVACMAMLRASWVSVWHFTTVMRFPSSLLVCRCLSLRATLCFTSASAARTMLRVLR